MNLDEFSFGPTTFHQAFGNCFESAKTRWALVDCSFEIPVSPQWLWTWLVMLANEYEKFFDVESMTPSDGFQRVRQVTERASDEEECRLALGEICM